MPRVFVAVGSNLGDRLENFSTARDLAAKIKETRIVRQSPVYETEPVGGPPQGKYLNAVWELETALDPETVLRELLRIEIWMGRERAERNAPRVIDLDLLSYDQALIEEPGMSVPHPRLHEREFVLRPFMDLDPDWVHPKLQKNIRTLWEEWRAAHSKS